MERKILVLSLALILLAGSLMGYKVWGAGYSLVPRSRGDVWSVELQLRFRATKTRASARANLPLSNTTQVILDAQNHSPALDFSSRRSDQSGENVLAVWSGKAKEVQTVTYRFAVRTLPLEVPVPDKDFSPPNYPDEVARWLRESSEVPYRNPAVQELSRELVRDGMNNPAKIKAAYEFVFNEIGFVSSKDQMDALIAINQQEANSRGKARLLCALSRAAGIPCRIVGGLILREGETDDLHLWNEIYLNGMWIPFCPTRGYWGKVPKNYLVLRTGGEPILQGVGTQSFSYRFAITKQPETLLQLYTGQTALANDWLRTISLFSLPVKTQNFFRILLLIPLGALIVALFRNVFGVPSFGVFTPILIAIAFRDTGILWGLFFLVIVVVLGVAFRYVLDALQLLLVPRLSILLSIVVLILLGVALSGGELGTEEAASVALFPIVIMTTVIERFSIKLAEEGVPAALVNTFWTVVIALTGYGVLAAESIQLFLFAFPETELVIIAVLLLIGRYTGYRVSDVVRFRSLVTS